MESSENIDIVIVGAGICGLAAALALHKKGIRSIVLEKSETLRTTGVGIIIMPNGWRALDQLGVASMLRRTSFRIESACGISLEDGQRSEIPVRHGEIRCLKRMELIKTLAEELPPETIRFDSKIVSVEYDHNTSYPLLHLHDGTVLSAKIVIGCDGVYSIIANEIGLCPTKSFLTCAVRGFSYYEEGHEFGKSLLAWSTNEVQIAGLPVTDKLVYWFSTWEWPSHDYAKASKDPMLIREYVMENVKGFHQQVKEMIEKSDVNSLHLTHIRYRAPWDLFRGNLRRGTITVAGDAMHAMGPSIAQAGSVSLEDAIVLARCISSSNLWKAPKGRSTKKAMEEALDKYIEERKMRVFWVSLETYLSAMTTDTSSKIFRFLSILLRSYLFRDPVGSTRYDCGTL